jgi:hypothetical protein
VVYGGNAGVNAVNYTSYYGADGEAKAGRYNLRRFPGYLKWRSPILEKQTVESPYCAIVWQF